MFMKLMSTNKLLSILIVVYLISPVLIGTGAYDTSWRGSFDVNYVDPSDNLSSRYESEYGIGINIEYDYHKYLGMLASGRFVDFNRSRGSGDSDLTIIYFMLDGILKYPILEDWEIFAAGGLGVYAWDSEHAWWDGGRNAEAVDLGYNFGVGVYYTLYNRFDVGVKLFHHEVELDPDNRSSAFDDFSLSARFNF